MDPRTSVLEPKDAATLITTALLPPFALSHLPGLTSAAATQQIIPGGSQKDCIRLRGLPFEAQVGDIIQFLGELSNDIVCQGVHLIYKAEVRNVAWSSCCRIVIVVVKVLQSDNPTTSQHT